jgi:CRISPR-associated protein Csd1
MILQALKEYYDRKAADPESGIAPDGWEWKEMPFVAVIDPKGELVQIEDTREGEGKKKRAKAFLVPSGEKKTKGIKANLLWDTVNYALGIVNVDGLDPEEKQQTLVEAQKQKKAFVERIQKELTDTPKKRALLKFLTSINKKLLEKLPQWEELYQAKPNITFRFFEEQALYCQTEEVQSVVNAKGSVKRADGLCLVSGEKAKISVLHTAIKGVWGARQSGAKIVSFNRDSFCSFGKRGQQGKNAPVGEKAMFAYTTALNALLSKDSKQCLQVGDASTVFWSDKETNFENDFSKFFAEPPKDDPDANTQAVKNLFKAIDTGAYLEDSGKENFFVLGLAPNASRIAVRFWQIGTVGEFAEKIRQHFKDLTIVKPKGEPEYYSLWRILVNIATQNKSENILPNIAGDFMRTILEGRPYPITLLQTVIRRIKSDVKNRVTPVRAALIKACLNRQLRFQKKIEAKEVTMSLDKEQKSRGYVLGRLFAVLEKIQEEAGLSGIRERYYGAACGAPVTVFPTLLRLKNHHIAKLKNKDRAVNLEKLIAEILGLIPGDDALPYPAYFNLQEQGMFAVGYYHQRQDL